MRLAAATLNTCQCLLPRAPSGVPGARSGQPGMPCPGTLASRPCPEHPAGCTGCAPPGLRPCQIWHPASWWAGEMARRRRLPGVRRAAAACLPACTSPLVRTCPYQWLWHQYTSAPPACPLGAIQQGHITGNMYREMWKLFVKRRTGLARAHASGGAAGCRRSCCGSFCGGLRSQRQAQRGYAGALAQASRLQPLPRALQHMQNSAEAMRAAESHFPCAIAHSRTGARNLAECMQEDTGLGSVTAKPF